MAGNGIFIAKRKDERTHVFLRAYRREALEGVDFAFSADSLDRFLLAQDPESFTSAVSGFFPLSTEPLCRREMKSRPRKQTVEQFRANCKRFYEFVDEAILMEEYTGVKDDGTELNRSSLRRAAKEFDAVKNGNFLRYLNDNAFAESDYVIVEPVQDWTAAKAFVSNIILFQAYIGNEAASLDFNEMTTHNGYWIYGKTFDKRIKERVKQFTYNSEWRNETVGEVIADSFKSESRHSANPLLSKYFDWKDNERVNRLNKSQHVYFKGAPSVFGEPLSLFAKGRRAVTDRSLYLVADLDCPEREIARDFINAVVLTTQELRSENNKPLGWEYDYASALDEADKPDVVFFSQWSRLVYEVAFHPKDVKAAVCKNCGRPMLNRAGSKLRQFCRPSCKTTYSNAHRGGVND